MITDSPHRYQQHGEHAGVEQSIIAASLSQAESVESKGLVSVLTLNHLAYQTGSSYGYLRGIVERNTDPYTDLSIKRRNGRRMREISIPDPTLMEVQRWILRHILTALPTHHSSYAYTIGKSILQCARKHLGAGWIVKLDIRDFFTSITEAQAYAVFQGAGYVPLVSLELARICTRYAGHVDYLNRKRYKVAPDHAQYTTIKSYRRPFLGFLPQGAPTSGALANLASSTLDTKLSEIAEHHGCVYTRYADDLTFSSTGEFHREKALLIIREVRKALRSERLIMHEQKTSIITPGARKIVLGLLVDGDQVRISKGLRTRITAHVRGVEAFGLSPHVTHAQFSSIDGFVRHVSGMLAFVYDVEPSWAAQLQERWQTALLRDGWLEIPVFHD
jgi:RNA-directed DNA polymerase